jgi:hypothetical protein
MQQAPNDILIDFPAFASFLGISVRRIFRHRHAMEAAGAIENHFYQGRFYSVALPHRLCAYWKARSFD